LGPTRSAETSPERGRFAALCREFLAGEYAAAPVMASGLGLTEFDARLDDLSEAAFEERRRWSARWRERFRAVPDAGLGPDERIDRDFVVSILAGRETMAEWLPWRRQPEIYVSPGLYGTFGLFLHRLRPEADLVRDAAARLSAVPDLLAQGRRNLTPDLVAPVFVDRALGQARAGARYVRELLPAEAGDPALRGALAEAGAVAASAFEEYAGFLEGLRTRATGDFALGEARYGRLLREKEHVPLDAGALRERGRREYERLAAGLRQLGRRVGGTDDWPSVLELNQVEAMLFRAARIVVDTSLHSGDMTLEDARRFMEERANLTPGTARAEVARYAASPTQASAYLVGCLEILAIRERHLARAGSGVAVLRDFHDRLAGSGRLPPALAERALLAQA
jgi:uncharacterized protein (DUF885 family)